MDEEVRKFWHKQLEPFAGGRVVSIVIGEDEGQPLMGLEIRCVDGKLRQALAMRDEEGNGPGVIFPSVIPEVS